MRERGAYAAVPVLVALATLAALALASCSPTAPTVGDGPLERPTMYDRPAVAEDTATHR